MNEFKYCHNSRQSDETEESIGDSAVSCAIFWRIRCELLRLCSIRGTASFHQFETPKKSSISFMYAMTFCRYKTEFGFSFNATLNEFFRYKLRVI